MKNHSAAECQKILVGISPAAAVPQEKTRVVSETQTEVRVVLNATQMAKLEKLRGLLSHQVQPGSNAQLLEKIMDIALGRVDRSAPKVEKTRPAPVVAATNSAAELGNVAKSPALVQAQSRSLDPGLGQRSSRLYIPIGVQKEVWRRDQDQCTCRDTETGRRCGSTYRLEIDHVVPVSLGGDSGVNNLRLLCKAHNLFEAVQKLGAE